MNTKIAVRNYGEIAKKAIVAVTTIAIMLVINMKFALAATGEVNVTDFIKKSMTVLKAVLYLIGGGVGLWGVVNLLEGYGNDNPGAKSQGMKQLMGGLGIILLAAVLVPVLQTMMEGAMS